MDAFDLKHLRVFGEVVRQGSLSGAADTLSYTQPAVSQLVAALERRLGTPLLDRLPRGVRPTAAGAALARHAETILASASLAVSELEAIAAGEGGRLRVASFPTAGAALMPAAVTGFLELHPAVELEVSEAEPEESIEMLAAGELELAVVAERARDGEGDAFGALYASAELHPLLHEELYVLLHRGHTLAKRSRLRLEQLAGEPWVELGRGGSGSGRRVHVASPSDHTDPERQVAFRSDDVNVVQGMVAAGAGVAVVPGLALVGLNDDIVARSLGAVAPRRVVAAATAAGVHRSAVTEAFLAVLAGVAADWRAPLGR